MMCPAGPAWWKEGREHVCIHASGPTRHVLGEMWLHILFSMGVSGLVEQYCPNPDNSFFSNSQNNNKQSSDNKK